MSPSPSIRHMYSCSVHRSGMVSTSLRTGNPLPQITPCPLLDRFMVHTHGLNVIRQEADDDYGLPRTMTIDTLENEQYLCVARTLITLYALTVNSLTGASQSASPQRSVSFCDWTNSWSLRRSLLESNITSTALVYLNRKVLVFRRWNALRRMYNTRR